MVTKDNWQGFWFGVCLMFAVVIIVSSLVTYCMNHDNQCHCTVNIGNSTLSVEDAFEYVTKGLSAHQYLEVQQAIDDSKEQ